MCYSVISKMFDLFDEEEGVCHRSFLIIDDKYVVLRRALFLVFYKIGLTPSPSSLREGLKKTFSICFLQLTNMPLKTF